MFLVTPRTALNLRKGEGDVCWTNRPKKELKREKLGTAMELLFSFMHQTHKLCRGCDHFDATMVRLILLGDLGL